MNSVINFSHALDTLRISLDNECRSQKLTAQLAEARGVISDYEHENAVHKGMAEVLEGKEVVETVDGYGDRRVHCVLGCINTVFLGETIELALSVARAEYNRLQVAVNLASDDDYPEELGKLLIWTRVHATLTIWSEG